MLNLKQIANLVDADDQLVIPALHMWMLQHSDDALEDQVAQRIYELLRTQPRYRGQSFSASAAHQCPRAQVLGFLDAPGQLPDQQLSNIFMDGKWRHLRWQAMMLSADACIDVEFPLDWPRYRLKGSMDALGLVRPDHPVVAWRGKEFGIELKGVSTFQFVQLIKSGPLDHHLGQIARYMLIGGYDLFSLIYEDKTTQAVKEWVIDRSQQHIQDLIVEQWHEIEELNKAIDDKKLPSMLPECIKHNGPVFKDCSFGGTKHGVCPMTARWPKAGTFRKGVK